jgi:hypothetical protein
VAKPDKLFGQIGDDPLGAAIETRRNALNEGSDLCDLHGDLILLPANTNACSVRIPTKSPGYNGIMAPGIPE